MLTFATTAAPRASARLAAISTEDSAATAAATVAASAAAAGAAAAAVAGAAAEHQLSFCPSLMLISLPKLQNVQNFRRSDRPAGQKHLHLHRQTMNDS